MSQLLNLKKYLVFIMGCLLLCFQTNGFADDSTKVVPTVRTTPQINCSGGNAYHYQGNPLSCYTTIGYQGSLGDILHYTTHNYTSPLQTYNKTFNNGAGAVYQSVQVDGNYLVVATFEFRSATNNYIIYYWIDDWAVNDVDYGGASIPQNHRIFYSGDNPLVLNVGLNGSSQAYYSGIVHLHAGAKIYYPEVWLACKTGNCGTMTLTTDSGCIAGAGKCNCGDSTFMNGGSCFFVTLLSSP